MGKTIKGQLSYFEKELKYWKTEVNDWSQNLGKDKRWSKVFNRLHKKVKYFEDKIEELKDQNPEYFL